MLQCRFAVKLQKRDVAYETSPHFPMAWEWVDNDSIFFFGCSDIFNN